MDGWIHWIHGTDCGWMDGCNQSIFHPQCLHQKQSKREELWSAVRSLRKERVDELWEGTWKISEAQAPYYLESKCQNLRSSGRFTFILIIVITTSYHHLINLLLYYYRSKHACSIKRRRQLHGRTTQPPLARFSILPSALHSTSTPRLDTYSTHY